MAAARVAVLGGGIVGLTCAVALRLAGHPVTIVARESLLGDGLELSPLVASGFPAASVMAHSARVPERFAGHLSAGEEVFAALASEPADASAVRRQPHYQLFGGLSAAPPGPPPAGTYRDLVELPDLAAAEREVLRRAFAPDGDLLGWRFSIVFLEYPRYVARLAALARRIGVAVERAEVTRQSIERLDADAWVSCLGAEASALLGDDPLRNGLIAGVLVHDRVHGLADCRGELGIFSYHASMASGPCRHVDRGGRPTDLYCYPRSDRFVLGGTRELVTSPPTARGESAQAPGPETPVPGPPATLLPAHRQALWELYRVRLDDHALIVREGYRPVRLREDGAVAEPRIELAASLGRPLVHCYGFGGAGVALSWLAAAETGRLLDAAVGGAAGAGLGDRLERLGARLAGALAGSE